MAGLKNDGSAVAIGMQKNIYISVKRKGNHPFLRCKKNVSFREGIVCMYVNVCMYIYIYTKYTFCNHS